VVDLCFFLSTQTIAKLEKDVRKLKDKVSSVRHLSFLFSFCLLLLTLFTHRRRKKPKKNPHRQRQVAIPWTSSWLVCEFCLLVFFFLGVCFTYLCPSLVAELNLQDYAKAFRKHKISHADLLFLSDTDVAEVSISSLVSSLPFFLHEHLLFSPVF
jgi:hypothetical protein